MTRTWVPRPVSARLIPGVGWEIYSRIAQIDGHWLWEGGCNGGGYGVVSIDRTMQLVSRVMYQNEHHVLPVRLRATCSERRCVLPAHRTPTSDRLAPQPAERGLRGHVRQLPRQSPQPAGRRVDTWRPPEPRDDPGPGPAPGPNELPKARPSRWTVTTT